MWRQTLLNKGKKSFFEELAADDKQEKDEEPAIKEQNKQPQKKKRDKKKGRMKADEGDDDDDDEDVMEKLKKLSVQPSDEDEEEEVIQSISKGGKKNKGGNLFAALSQEQSDDDEEEGEDEEEAEKSRKPSKTDKNKKNKVISDNEEEEEEEVGQKKKQQGRKGKKNEKPKSKRTWRRDLDFTLFFQTASEDEEEEHEEEKEKEKEHEEEKKDFEKKKKKGKRNDNAKQQKKGKNSAAVSDEEEEKKKSEEQKPKAIPKGKGKQSGNKFALQILRRKRRRRRSQWAKTKEKPREAEGKDKDTNDPYANLSKKEKKKKKKLMEYEKQVASMKATSAAEGDFSISQAEMSSRQAMLENASDIKLERFSISAHGKELFINADLLIVAGRRYGLVGPNGKGKTTLLKHIANRALNIPPNIGVLLCEQEVIADDTPAVLAVLKADLSALNCWRRRSSCNPCWRGEDSALIDWKRCTRNCVRSGGSGRGQSSSDPGWAELHPEMQNRPTKKFSGGWRMRVSLARALFMEPTLLMLDEPTNHLDLNAVIWLNNYLQGWKKTLLIVSHDQGFLDDVCTDIIHLDYQKLFYYRGNYLTFKKMYVQKQKELQKQYDKQEKKLKDLKAGGKSTKQAEKQTKEALALKQQKGRKKNQEEEGPEQLELLKRPKEYTVKFTFPNPPPLSPPILGLHKKMSLFFLSCRFWVQSQKPLFKNVDFGIDMESRICIVGPNGVGKSTLLLLLTGKLTPTRGEMRKNHRLKVGFFNQQYADQLNMEENATEYLMRNFNLPYQDGRKCLGRFGLESHAHTIQISKLSGGQKARVVFAELSCRQPDVLILVSLLTNNLDIESIDALAEAINEYKGAVLIVSHDARLITETNCQLWVVEDQAVNQIDGDFEDYKREVLESREVMVNKPENEDLPQPETRGVGGN
ncbi:ATP-binding cassette sub-family F member 1-like [Acipenser oxyrinchus oxyrinchus]|uniref:ATP-binding cassette sub-family F member 1-like n=1 Tax=Acipenser oxyrinchus oxyrinchus TaxID=40147 RepID=A0AAD8CFW4_ACIOX|nr:ATP-binding cassette sub-family F member 1-like [Acipenser oxyrinchus oxyrinchus]